MKKRTLLSLALVAFLAVSCYDNGNHTQGVYLYGLSKIESNYHETNRTVTITNNFDLVNVSGMSGMPRLASQTITGDTLTRIEYTYRPGKDNKDSLVLKRYATNGRIWKDSLLLNDKRMAVAAISEDGTVTQYGLRYSDKSMRTMVGEYQISSDQGLSQGLYREASKDGVPVATYTYSSSPNLIGVQQLTILGDPYYWQSSCFGEQSELLLFTATVTENGEKVKYQFNYTFDSDGLMSTEIITRNDKPYLRNIYTYTRWLVSNGGGSKAVKTTF
ncbi:MAG: hypothetical protein RR485_07375 [Mucinivorans sp.]